MVGDEDGLDSKNLSTIRSTVLEAREMIEEDLKRQLERYGVYPDERMDKENLSHLDLEDMETRREIDAAFEREMSATEDQERSYKNYVKDATFHHLNRLFALKMLEERDFIIDTLEKKPEFGNRSEMNRVLSEVAGELCEAEDGGLGDALELAYDELSEEIGVIFEDNDYTAIDLDFKVRNDVIELFEEIDSEIWEADETIGWMYQYFGKKEREEIDDKIDEENYKVKDTDIGVKTQLFTPRYIVEWMVDNSLGRLWLEMDSESNINDEEKCFYLAPLEESLIDREKKDVSDIKVLDPACGSGHMLFYAFDVLYEMYLEEGEVPEKYIPNEILKNNLYAIDIDPRAVQLAALSLYVKAKSKEPDVPIEQINVVSADAVLVNGEKKREILKRLNGKLEKEVVKQIWDSFENIREYGSLVRVEEKVDEILEQHWDMVKKGQTQFTEGGLSAQTAFAEKGSELWDRVRSELLDKVKVIAEEALEHNNPVEEMFADELEKSIRLLDLFLRDYDVVVTNPPYLASRKIGEELKKFVKENYIGSLDLYTAFIERCLDFTLDDGYTTMVTLENYLFIYSYRKLRKNLVSNYQLIEGAHLSGHGFSTGDRPFTIVFNLRNRDPSNFKTSRFYRMTHEQEEYAHYQDKIRGLEEITKANRNDRNHEDVYVLNQNSFRNIGRTPFVYWFGSEILQIFKDNPTIGELAVVKQGLSTANDDKFVRKWWEIEENKINNKYYWFMPSGENKPYYYSTEKLVNWENGGKELHEYHDIPMDYQGAPVRNKSYYFKKGIGVRYFGKYLTARLHPEGYIFSNHSNYLHTDDEKNDLKALGFINSSFSRYIISGFSAQLAYQVGEIKNIPTKSFEKYDEKLTELVKKGITYRKEICSTLETKKEFDFFGLGKSIQDFNLVNNLNKSNVMIIHGLIDNIIFDEYNISERTQTRIYDDLPKNLSKYPHIINSGNLETNGDYEFRSKVPTKELQEDQYEEIVEDIEELADKDLRYISEELEISPYTVAMAKRKHDLYTNDEKEEAAGRLLSYYLGCIMGRWDLEGLEPDDNGIVVFDETFDDNVVNRLRECIELTYGEDEAYEKEREIEDMLGKDIEEWMKNKFFRYHHCKEYRRRGQRIPIYWHLESEGGTFSCFVYYHKMDSDTFLKVKGRYVDKKIERIQNRLRSIEDQISNDDVDGSRKKELRNEKEKLLDDREDLKDFASRLDELIKESFEPDFEAGIWENIQKIDEYDLLAVPLDKL